LIGIVNITIYKMIVVQLTGSIGDQLFQYAAARNFSLIYKCQLFIDNTWFYKNKKNNINPNKTAIGGFNTVFAPAGSAIINDFLRRKESYYLLRFPHTARHKVIRENKISFTKELYMYNPPFLMIGDFKSETYFEDHIWQIKEELTLNNSFLPEIITLVEEIVKTNSVAIYIFKNKGINNQNLIQDIIDFNYYQKAIDMIEDDNIEKDIIFFTNIDEEIISQLKIQGNYRFQKLFENDDEWKNLFLMSKCKYFVADNSANSWWAAWLNFDDNRIVITPQSFQFEYPKLTHNKVGIQQNWIKI